MWISIVDLRQDIICLRYKVFWNAEELSQSDNETQDAEELFQGPFENDFITFCLEI